MDPLGDVARGTLLVVIVLVEVGCHPSQQAERRALHRTGMAAYGRKEFAACGPLLESALDFYDAACCYAQAGARDAAFNMLDRAVAKGLHERDIAKDSDLDALHGDGRWPATLERAAAAKTALRRTLDDEMTRLFDEDQADRALPYDKIDWSKVTPRDQARRQRIDAILTSDSTLAADDYYHAAMVYQHGKTLEEIQRAHDLALKAVQLDPTTSRHAGWPRRRRTASSCTSTSRRNGVRSSRSSTENGWCGPSIPPLPTTSATSGTYRRWPSRRRRPSA